MNVTGSATTSLIDSVLSTQAAREELNVEMLKKAQDLHTQQGVAAIELLETSAPAPDHKQLDIYV